MKENAQPGTRRRRIWSNGRAAVALVWQATPRWTLVTILLAPALAALPLVILYLFKLIIDRVGGGIGGAAGWEGMGVLFGWIAGAAVLQESLRAFGAYAEVVMAEQVFDHVHGQLHRKSVAVDLAYYERPDFHGTLYRVQRDAGHRSVVVLRSVVSVGQGALSLAGVAVVLATLHWGVTLMLVASTVPGVALRVYYTGRAYLRHRDWTTADRYCWYFHELMTGSSHAKEVRLFGLGDWLQRRFAGMRKEVKEERLAFQRRRGIVEWVAQVSASLAMYGALAWATSLALAGLLTLGALVLYFQAFQRGLTTMREFLSAFASVHEQSLFLTDFHDFLALENSLIDPAAPRPIPTPLLHGIRFEDVAFQYPGTDRPVLQGITLEIARGETVAIVGANGAGKTTLIKLLCRLHDPTSGKITVDGIDLRLFAVAEWRRQVDVLFQDYARYNLTIRENIAFGEEKEGGNAVRTAAEAAGVTELMAKLPKGEETVLGNEYVEGALLSGGEWQKIALARSLMRASPIVVLDEPSSSIDVGAEAELLRRFRQLMRGRTAILISHRLAFAQEVDRIFVMDDGRIVESGNHVSLMARGGKYAGLFNLQAARYQENSARE